MTPGFTPVQERANDALCVEHEYFWHLGFAVRPEKFKLLCTIENAQCVFRFQIVRSQGSVRSGVNSGSSEIQQLAGEQAFAVRTHAFGLNYSQMSKMRRS
ncbi:hypothetical protein CSW57_21295 [Williamsia muralis]|uniref:Uncharacterized protein n=1 Tax=Williamsia marianensis TaxID=85044 RepID=A0A2G3PK90_WILMA|nr:hypothetical protein CSW57_21295 [Williamsia marianensis]